MASPRTASPCDEPRPRFSFEDQLTFAPKLNALSMKMAKVNRTSIIHRKKEDKKSVVNLSDQLFKPCGNSSKIVAKMKTGFWERQEKHMKHQQQMIDLGPSTIHPNLRLPTSKTTEKHTKSSASLIKFPSQYTKKKSKSLTECISDDKTLPTPIIGRCDNKNAETVGTNNNSHEEVTNVDEKHSPLQNDIRLTNSTERVKDQGHPVIDKDNSNKHMERNKVMISPRKVVKHSKTSENTINKDKITTKLVVDSKLNTAQELLDDDKNENIPVEHKEDMSKVIPENAVPNKCKKKHNRHLTHPLTQDQMDENHQQMLKLKKAAEKAIKNKKIFICNGPYHTLRSSLRRRGWIEKYFKGEGTLNQNVSSDLKQDQSNNNVTQEHDLLCNGHYGLMSRIIRNSTPSFIWTLRRDDIDFRFLKRDQMVNHFVCAWTFTTKAGLCSNLRNVHYFQNIHCNSFFPRCYRLCCDNEKEEFIDDYRMTAALSILKLVVLRHELWQAKEETSNMSEEDSLNSAGSKEDNKKRRVKILPTNALALAMKACHSYLDTQQHLDIEEAYIKNDRDLDEPTWRTIVNYYYQILNHDAMISDASSHVDACQDILSQMSNHFLQMNIDGYRNLWILKPGAKSRGRGIELKSQLDDILNITSDNVSKKENRWVIQKYIEQPLLIYRTKFDIRQWFLVTDWNPLVLWFYKDCYIRFCGQEFTFDDLGPQYHLSNNSVQKHYPIGERSEHLPDSNMWSSDEFKEYLLEKGHKTAWENVIYAGMKKAIIAVLQACQDSLDYRKNSFELYGADFMLSEDLKPWLIEINSSPALGASTDVTERLCRNVIDDTLKVVLDRHDNKQCDVGRYELAFKQPHIPIPTYMGCNLSVDGLAIKSMASNHLKKQKIKPLDCRLKMTTTATDEVKSNSRKDTFESHNEGEKENSVGRPQVEFTHPPNKNENLTRSCSDTSVTNTSSHSLSVTPLLPVRKLSDTKLSSCTLVSKTPSVDNTISNDESRDRHNCSRCGGNDEHTVDMPSNKVESYDVRCLDILKRATPLMSMVHRSKKMTRKKSAVMRYKNQLKFLSSDEMSGTHKLLNYPLCSYPNTEAKLKDLYVKPTPNG